jgi:hypothetical protein
VRSPKQSLEIPSGSPHELELHVCRRSATHLPGGASGKKNFKAAEEELLEMDRKHVPVTPANKFKNRTYIKINTTEFDAAETARIIKERFGLPGYG